MSKSVTITVSDHSCVAGGIVAGEVVLNFPLLQEEQIEEVHVKFRGSVYIFISPARTDLAETRDIDVVRDQVSVWSRGSAYPPPDSHLLRIPFLFRIPQDIPPSFEFGVLESRAVVRYGVEAVGVRPGALRLNKRLFVAIVGLPLDPAGARLRWTLRSGWTGGWKSVVKRAQIRAGFWGEYADVSVEFKYPALEAFPLFACIPFTLTVTTISKTFRQAQVSENKPIWPTPPIKPGSVRMELQRSVYAQTNHLTWTHHERICSLGNFGESYNNGGDVEVQVAQKEWLPVDPSKGRWKQQTSFSSNFSLTCPPSFKFPTLIVEYNISVVIPFSGLNNNVRLELPVTVSSGMVPSLSPADPDYAAPPSDDAGQSLDDVDYAIPPPTLDLPPSYWSAAV